jgi:hypothetical protein
VRGARPVSLLGRPAFHRGNLMLPVASDQTVILLQTPKEIWPAE